MKEYSQITDLTTEIENNRNQVATQCGELTDTQQQYVQMAVNKSFKMPNFKAKHFVGQAQITPYGAIRQFFLELKSRETSLLDLEYQLEKIELAIDEEKYALENAENEFDKRRSQIEIKYMNGKRDGYLQNLRINREERKMYANMIEQLNAEFKTPDGTTLIEALNDPTKEEELERDYWIKRLGKQAATDMIAYGRVGVGNVDALTMLEKEDQREALQLASDVLVWNENRMNKLLVEANTKYQSSEHTDSELAELLKLTKE